MNPTVTHAANGAHAGAQGRDVRRVPSTPARLRTDPVLSDVVDYGTAD